MPALVQTFGGQQGQGLAQGVDTRNGRRVMIPVDRKHQTRPKSMHSQTAKQSKTLAISQRRKRLSESTRNIFATISAQ